MNKIDFKKQLKHLYQPSAKEVVLVDVPSMNFLMVDGQGDPNTSQSYADAIQALFPVSYTLKFMVKKGPTAIDYGVLPLEGWTAMIMQPDFITKDMVDSAVKNVKEKKNLPALSKLRFQSLSEGKCAQILHIGPFSEEGPNILKVHKYIDDIKCTRTGKHHEIYLSDIRKATPSKWKTIIRQPMK
jgi:hypothetical protein